MTRPLPLDPLGVLAVRGPDARRFLNGQLSQDALSLDTTMVRLAGLHNPQGRTLAVLRLVAALPGGDGGDAVLCVLPRDAIPEVRALLSRFLLRAKATLADESDAWRVEGLWPSDPAAAALAAAEPGAATRHGDAIIWRHAPDGRCLRLSPRPMPGGSDAQMDGAAALAWRLADIAAGLPEVHPATRGAFVAQMLNLDALGGISFTKGCYTGQEVIARAHYRGRVKRRLQRFEAAAPGVTPAPGDTLRLTDGRTAQVVEAAVRPDGRLEFLAVAPLSAAPSTGATDGGGDAADPDGASAAPRLEAIALPLPYALPA
jgi:folate-binding protein YgfZ